MFSLWGICVFSNGRINQNTFASFLGWLKETHETALQMLDIRIKSNDLWEKGLTWQLMQLLAEQYLWHDPDESPGKKHGGSHRVCWIASGATDKTHRSLQSNYREEGTAQRKSSSDLLSIPQVFRGVLVRVLVTTWTAEKWAFRGTRRECCWCIELETMTCYKVEQLTKQVREKLWEFSATFCHHCQNNNLMVTIARRTDFNLKTYFLCKSKLLWDYTCQNGWDQ